MEDLAGGLRKQDGVQKAQMVFADLELRPEPEPLETAVTDMRILSNEEDGIADFPERYVLYK